MMAVSLIYGKAICTMHQLSASILSANFLKLGEEVTRVEKAGCDCLHIDIIDGHFAPNLAMGLNVAEAVCAHTCMRKDVHLMIANPEQFIKSFADAGVDSITFHAEATVHPFEIIKYIRETGKMVGVALDPGTPIEAIRHYIDAVDIVLLVAVCVGFGGQKYIDAVDKKILQLNHMKREAELDFEIQVDGGINADNALDKVELGVDTLVAGSMFFLADNVEEVIRKVK